MKNKFIKTIIICLAAFGLAFTPLSVFADQQCSSEVCSRDYPDSVKSACGCGNSTGNQLPIVIRNILNAIIGVSGLVAVIFVIIGGINYMTSAGDSGKLKKAKDTILYALIGLAICALSFAIVNFTIHNIIQGQTSSSEEKDNKS